MCVRACALHYGRLNLYAYAYACCLCVSECAVVDKCKETSFNAHIIMILPATERRCDAGVDDHERAYVAISFSRAITTVIE